MKLNESYGDDYLTGIRNGTILPGLGIGCDLDNHLRYKEGNFNLIVGQSNVGKTDWIMWYLTALSVKHKLRWFIFSSENTIGNLKQKILQFRTGKKLKDLNDEDFNKANYWLKTKFMFVDTDKLYTAGQLLQVFENHKDEYDGIIIDPYNSLIKENGVNSHEYDYRIASEIRIFCRTNKKTVYIIAHAVTESLRKKHADGEYKGFPKPPDSSDIEGGGKWVNRADDFIVIHRYVQHEHEWMDTHVHIRKVKETETGGKPTFLESPVIFKKMYEKFLINRIDPISDTEEKEKPLQINADFDMVGKGEEQTENEDWKINEDKPLPF